MIVKKCDETRWISRKCFSLYSNYATVRCVIFCFLAKFAAKSFINHGKEQ
jgi:hypothetical protein